MPNIRRTYPGSSSNAQEQHYPVYRGGKQLGKALRPQEDDDDDESEESEEDTPQYVVNRGSGKQMAGGGKYFRPQMAEHESESEEEEDDEPPQRQTVRVQPRPGGKNILRMQQPDESEESEEESEDEKPPPVQTYRVVGRGGGKSLSRMLPQQESEEEEDSDEEDEPTAQRPVPTYHGKVARRPEGATVAAAAKQVKTLPPKFGGKQLRRPEPEPAAQGPPVARGSGKQFRAPVPLEDDDDEDSDDDVVVQKVVAAPAARGKQLRRPAPEPVQNPVSIARSPGGGKQLRRPVEPETQTASISRSSGGGKQLRPPESEPPRQTVAISRSSGGGKQLRRAPEKDDEEDEPPKKTSISRSPGGGKQLRRPEPEEPPKKPTAIARSPGGGKQLRRGRVEESEDDDDEEELFDDDDSDSDEDFEEPAKKKKPAKKAPAKKKSPGRPKRAAAPRKQIVEESEEEIFGDADTSSDEDEELDINNTEALIKDEADRKYLDSLPELEREAILGERFEAAKEKQDLQKAVREAKRGKATAAQKRKAPAQKSAKKKKLKTDGDEDLAKSLANRRSSARERDASGAKSKKAAALAALKRERKIQQEFVEESSDESEIDFGDDEDSDEEYEEAGLKPWQKKAQKAKAAARASVKTEDDGSDMDIDDDEAPSRSRKQSGSKDASLEDFLKVTIPRRRLARWCNEPFFNAAVLECFVRLFIGEDDNGEKVYRLCEIIDVNTEQKSYKFPVAKAGDKPISTDKYLRLKFGVHERDFPMYLISDTPPSEADVQKYYSIQKNNRREILGKRRAAKLRRLQDQLVSTYTYTKEDIERNIQERQKQGKALGNLGSIKTKVEIAVQAAKQALAEATQRFEDSKTALHSFTGPSHQASELRNDVEENSRAVEAAKKELDKNLQEERDTLNAVKDRKRRLTGRQKDQNWAKVNKRALEMNQQADRQGYRSTKSSGGVGEKEKFNPYARRKVKPKILWEVGQDADDDTKMEEKKDSNESTKKETAATTTDKRTPAFVQDVEKASAMSDAHQFAIDEEGLAQTGLGLEEKKKRPVRNRKGLSLNEYLERKGNNTL